MTARFSDDELDDPGKPEGSDSFNWPLAVWIIVMVPYLTLMVAMQIWPNP